MKNLKQFLGLMIIGLVVLQSCKKTDATPVTPVVVAPDFSGTYTLKDQMGRPGINTVFIPADKKDLFNNTLPSAGGALFKDAFAAGLKALSPAYAKVGDKNALGLDAPTFGGLLASDVLNVHMTKPTTYFDGTNVLTGRNPSDDVISVSLLLIFGGDTGTKNPGLSDDNVSKNDKSFTNTFPYLATPW